MKLATEIRWQDRAFAVPVERIQLTEQWGYDAVFTAESTGSDALTPLGYLAAITRRLKLGTHIAVVTGRSPATLAMAFQTIDAMAGGNRVIAGLGTSQAAVTEGWHGRRWGSAYHHMKDYVAVMRQVAAGQPLEHRGKELAVPYAGEGSHDVQAVRTRLVTNPDVPIMLGVFKQQMVTLAGEIADGLMPTGFRPGAMERFRPWLEEGFRRAGGGKGFHDFDLWCQVDMNVDDDVRLAMRPFKQYVCVYPARQLPLMAEAGYGDAAERVAERLDDRRDKGLPPLSAGDAWDDPVLDLVPDDYIDGGWLCGPVDRIVKQLEPWRDSGLTGMILRYGAQVGGDFSGGAENLEAFRAIAKALDKPGSD